ncbi:hypothetical protein STRIP9103_01108 [Streptomyces ipomoeae 91-03]|uniref:Cupin type-1 domain-containing protein n=1 Tax=Streptomyces ipomoeae 91-03 TaxID=698759 RepID=L1KYJ7_9ACTN|nr:hypothetical protein STRIP9103_01108 [Streptomyces ipomoeae 91-03]
MTALTPPEGLLVPPGHGRTVTTPGTVIVVPPGCPHSFANPTDVPAKMFFQSSPPPDHERHSEELPEILGAGGPPAEDSRPRGAWDRATSHGEPAARIARNTPRRYRIGIPDKVRAITSR